MFNLFLKKRKKKIYKKLDEYKRRIEKNNFDYKFVLNETKHVEPVLLYWSTDDEVCMIIHLMGFFKGKPTHSQINLIFKGDKLFIADIQVLDKRIFNRGYGSLLLEQALQEAKRRNVKIVDGILKTENKAHFNRQKHFYEKFGFSIIDESKIHLTL